MSEHEDAKELVREMFRHRAKTGPKLTYCTSSVQKLLQCGYNRAARIMDDLEHEKFISAADAHGDRVLL